MKIDAFNHLFPKPYFDRMLALGANWKDMARRVRVIPCIVDLDARFRIMDEFGPTTARSSRSPRRRSRTSDADAADDGDSSPTTPWPSCARSIRERFFGFVAALPMNDPDAHAARSRARHDPARRLRRAGLHQRARQAAHRARDAAALRPDGASSTCRSGCTRRAARTFPTTPRRRKSDYEIWWTFGWPYETSVAMARIVFAGLYDKHPNLKIITHHLGGMIPYFEGRVGPGWDQLGKRTSDEDLRAKLWRG